MDEQRRKRIEKIIAESDCLNGFKCQRHYRCYDTQSDPILKGFNPEQLCKAKDNGWGKYLQCMEEKQPNCAHAMHYGGIYICTCPIRYEIENHLKKSDKTEQNAPNK